MRLASAIRSPVGAAALSAIFPGLGQAAAGHRLRGAIVAIPALAMPAWFAFVVLSEHGSLFDLALNQNLLASLFVVNAVAAVYHVWAIFDAYWIARRAQPKPARMTDGSAGRWAAILGVLLVLSGTVAVHGVVAQTDANWQHALYCLTAPTPCWVVADGAPRSADPTAPDPGNGVGSPIPSGAVGSPLASFDLGALPSFLAPAGSWTWNPNGQLNVLLAGIGVQSDPSQLGPDTIMVLHVDRTSGRAALVSVGRNNVCVPLPQGMAQHFATPSNGCPAYTWPGLLNDFPNEVLGHCEYFPLYSDTCGQPRDPNRYLRAYRAFEQVVGGLLGLTIDGSMWVNPVGLTGLIDALGGVDVNVPTTVHDEPCGPPGTWQNKFAFCPDAHNGYSVPTGVAGVQRMVADAKASGGLQSVGWSQGQDISMVIKAGQQHMDGDWALAYARTRIFTSDFDRAARQQLVLKALRDELDPCRFADPGNVVSLLGGVSAIPYAFNSDLPITNPQDLHEWAGLAKGILGGDVKSIVLDPVTAHQSYLTIGGITYPAVDAVSWATIKGIVAASLVSVPSAGHTPGSPTGTASGC